MANDPNGISTKDHLVALIEQLKESLTGQLSDLRSDIKHMQTNFVSRAEHELVVSFLKGEISRIERESKQMLRDHIDDDDRKVTRIIGITAVVSSIVIGIVQAIVSLLK